MASAKQHERETKRWPHVKQNWIRAIKKIRAGGVFSEIFIWYNMPRPRFLPPSGRLNEELEDKIAEHIYDWWISRKSYQKWYNDKFVQKQIEFKEDEKV